MLTQWEFYHASPEERDEEYRKALAEIEKLKAKAAKLNKKLSIARKRIENAVIQGGDVMTYPAGGPLIR